MTKDNEDALRCADGVERMDTFTDYQRAELLKSADHLRRLVAENEAKDALLRQAVEAWDNEQSMLTAIIDIRQHLEGRA